MKNKTSVYKRLVYSYYMETCDASSNWHWKGKRIVCFESKQYVGVPYYEPTQAPLRRLTDAQCKVMLHSFYSKEELELLILKLELEES